MVDLTSIFTTIRIDTDAEFFSGLNVADTVTLFRQAYRDIFCLGVIAGNILELDQDGARAAGK